MIVKSQSPDVTIPEVPITEYVLRHAERLGDKPALIDGPTGRTLTYRQLKDGVRQVAAGLAKRGLKPGDVLAIYSPNLPEYALALLGSASLGGDHHHRQSAVHGRRAGEAAPGLARALPRDGAAIPRQGPGGRGEGRHRGHLRVRDGGGGARRSRSSCRRRDHAAGAADQPARRHRGPAVLERHHGPAEGRDADAQESRGEPLPGRGHEELRRLRRERRHDGRAALLSHLRHGRHHDAGTGQRRHRRRDAALRPPGVPRARAEAPSRRSCRWCRPSCSGW